MARRIIFETGLMLTARIKARLAENARVGAMRVHVKTSQGIAELSGFALSAEDRELIGKIAVGVRDVKSVRNNIFIRSPG